MALDVAQDKTSFTCMVMMRRDRQREDRRGKVEKSTLLFINPAFSYFILQMNLMEPLPAPPPLSVPLSSATSAASSNALPVALCKCFEIVAIVAKKINVA